MVLDRHCDDLEPESVSGDVRTAQSLLGWCLFLHGYPPFHLGSHPDTVFSSEQRAASSACGDWLVGVVGRQEVVAPGRSIHEGAELLHLRALIEVGGVTTGSARGQRDCDAAWPLAALWRPVRLPARTLRRAWGRRAAGPSPCLAPMPHPRVPVPVPVPGSGCVLVEVRGRRGAAVDQHPAWPVGSSCSTETRRVSPAVPSGGTSVGERLTGPVTPGSTRCLVQADGSLVPTDGHRVLRELCGSGEAPA